MGKGMPNRSSPHRCYDCSVLPGRDHLNRCNSPAARRQRQEWLREDARERGERDPGDYPV